MPKDSPKKTPRSTSRSAPTSTTRKTPASSPPKAAPKPPASRSKTTNPNPTGPTSTRAKATPQRPAKPLTKAQRADIHDLYQRAVQNVTAEIDFVDKVYHTRRHKRATKLREDFCGTANSSCEWVRRRPTNTAVGLDLDQPTLDWGIAHNLSILTPKQRDRVTLHNRNVLEPGDAIAMDVILAMNFSYWIFKSRETLRSYFKQVHRSLNKDGLFILDFFGGPDSQRILKERRPCRGFTYIWDQAAHDPLTADYVCHIHFAFPDGSRIRNAFTYHWRLWTLPEIRELLAEAGFTSTTIYLEGDDGKGGGNGDFQPAAVGENCLAWLAYIVAQP